MQSGACKTRARAGEEEEEESVDSGDICWSSEVDGCTAEATDTQGYDDGQHIDGPVDVFLLYI